MGVYDSIEKLKEQESMLTHHLLNVEQSHQFYRRDVKETERLLAIAKKTRNFYEREKKRLKKELLLTQRKIKSHPSQVRKYVKEHPFSILTVNN